MVRLVFRPYTQIRRAICTSASLRASTRVSSGFALFRHSSPSFGSQQYCSGWNALTMSQHPPNLVSFILFAFTAPMGLRLPSTRSIAKLLGPCFKTGRIAPFRGDPHREGDALTTRSDKYIPEPTVIPTHYTH